MPAPYPQKVATFTGYNQITISSISWPFGFEYNKPANFCNWLDDGASFSAGNFPPLSRSALGYTLAPYEAVYGFYGTYSEGAWSSVYLPASTGTADETLQWIGIVNNTVVFYSPSAGDLSNIHFAVSPLQTSNANVTPTMYDPAWPLAGQPQIIGPLPALLAGSYTRPRLFCWENGLTGYGCALDDVTGVLTTAQLWAGADVYMAGNYSPSPQGMPLTDGTNIILWAGRTAGTNAPYEPVIINAVGSSGAEVYRCVAALSETVHNDIFQLASDQAAMGDALPSPAGFVFAISTSHITPPSFFVVKPDWSEYSLYTLVGGDDATKAMLLSWGFVEMNTAGLQIIGAAASNNVEGSFYGFVDHISEDSQAFTIGASRFSIPPVYPISVACTDCRPLWMVGEETY